MRSVRGSLCLCGTGSDRRGVRVVKGSIDLKNTHLSNGFGNFGGYLLSFHVSCLHENVNKNLP